MALIGEMQYLTIGDNTYSIPSSGGASAYTGTISAVGTSASTGTSNGFARGDHVHNLTKTAVDSVLGTGSGTTRFYREDGTWAAVSITAAQIVRW